MRVVIVNCVTLRISLAVDCFIHPNLKSLSVRLMTDIGRPEGGGNGLNEEDDTPFHPVWLRADTKRYDRHNDTSFTEGVGKIWR